MHRAIGDLFVPEPQQWGLRGDPYLWREMRDHFAAEPLPANPDALVAVLASAFQQLTGQPLSVPGSFYVERFSHGGMSSGHVCPEFWRERAMPMLAERYAQAVSGQTRA